MVVRYVLMNETFRKLATIGGVLTVLAATAQGGDRVDVWVLLTEPPVASATASLEKIKQQQETVAVQLKELGAVELGRVTTARNAIAVSIDPAKLPEVKRLSGVRSVSPVRDIQRDPPVPPVR